MTLDLTKSAIPSQLDISIRGYVPLRPPPLHRSGVKLNKLAGIGLQRLAASARMGEESFNIPTFPVPMRRKLSRLAYTCARSLVIWTLRFLFRQSALRWGPAYFIRTGPTLKGRHAIKKLALARIRRNCTCSADPQSRRRCITRIEHLVLNYEEWKLPTSPNNLVARDDRQRESAMLGGAPGIDL
jgi:hypothetical protein